MRAGPSPRRAHAGSTRRGAERLDRGYSLVEVLCVCGLVALLGGVTVPLVDRAIADARVTAAARFLAGQCGLARAEAVKRSVRVGLRFRQVGEDYEFRMYRDGNGNGIRSQDIARGLDPPLGDALRLGALFPGVVIGIAESMPGIDGSGPVGTDPVQLGVSDVLTYSPLGSATPGTIYVCGRRGAPWAVRVLGDTGRTRVLRFDRIARAWRQY